MKRINDAFDRFADFIADRVSHAWFFAFCKLLVLAWVIQGFVQDKWTDDLFHLELNSPTTAITFLLVALLHNTQHRAERAVHRKLDLLMRAAHTSCTDEAICAEMAEMLGIETVPSKE